MEEPTRQPVLMGLPQENLPLCARPVLIRILICQQTGPLLPRSPSAYRILSKSAVITITNRSKGISTIRASGSMRVSVSSVVKFPAIIRIRNLALALRMSSHGSRTASTFLNAPIGTMCVNFSPYLFLSDSLLDQHVFRVVCH